MEIIGRRYKNVSLISSLNPYDIYRVEDLKDKGNMKLLKLYRKNISSRLIDFYIDNFRYSSNVKHKSLQKLYDFDLIADKFDKNKSLNYFITYEEIEGTPLNKMIYNLKFKDRVNIIVNAFDLISYLHFRGIVYGGIKPENIYIEGDRTVKFLNFMFVQEDEILKSLRFNSGENQDIIDRHTDYKALGSLTKYLFLENYNENNSENFIFIDFEEIDENAKKIISNVINNLFNPFSDGNISLEEELGKINNAFKLYYLNDYREERSKIYDDIKIIEKEDEISEFKSVLSGNKNDYKGFLFTTKGNRGKTKLLEELKYRIRLGGLNYYEIKSSQLDEDSVDHKHGEIEEKDKKSESETCILEDISNLDFSDKIESEAYKSIREKILEYSKSIPKNEMVFYIVDDIFKLCRHQINLIDYILSNGSIDNIFLLISYDGYEDLVREKYGQVHNWVEKKYLKEFNLKNLTRSGTEKMIKGILGTGSVSEKLVDFVYKESEGNQAYIYTIVKSLYKGKILEIGNKGYWALDEQALPDLVINRRIDDNTVDHFNVVFNKYPEILKPLALFGNYVSEDFIKELSGMNSENFKDEFGEMYRSRIFITKQRRWGIGYKISSKELESLILDELDEKEIYIIYEKIFKTFKSNKEIDIEGLKKVFEYFYKEEDKRVFKDSLDIMLKDYDDKYSEDYIDLLKSIFNLVREEDNQIKLSVLGEMMNIYFRQKDYEEQMKYMGDYLRLSLLLEEYIHYVKCKYYEIRMKIVLGHLDVLDDIDDMYRVSTFENYYEGVLMAESLRTEVYMFSGNLEKAALTLDSTKTLIMTYKLGDYAGYYYNNLGSLLILRGEMEEGLHSYKKGLEFNRLSKNFTRELESLQFISNHYFDNLGEVENAIEVCRMAYGVASKYNVKYCGSLFRVKLANMYRQVLEVDKAEEVLKDLRNNIESVYDENLKFQVYINTGYMSILNADVELLHQNIEFLKNTYSEIGLDYNTKTEYFFFLGEAYSFLGDYERAKMYFDKIYIPGNPNNIRINTFIDFRRFRMDYAETGKYDRRRIKKIIDSYLERKYFHNLKFDMCNLVSLASVKGSKEDVIDFLNLVENEDYYTNPVYDEVKSFIEIYLEDDFDGINQLIKIEEETKHSKLMCIGVLYKRLLGDKLYEKELYIDSFSYLVRVFDIFYRRIKAIDNNINRLRYIKSYGIDQIRDKIYKILNKVFGLDVSQYINSNENEEEFVLDEYFNISSLLKEVSNLEMIESFKKYSFYSDDEVQSLEDLVLSFDIDYVNNLNKILKYIGKISLSMKSFLYNLDEESGGLSVITSVGLEDDRDFRERLVRYAIEKEEIVYYPSKDLKELELRTIFNLGDTSKTAICLPIIDKVEVFPGDKRSDYTYPKHIEGVLYLESNKLFNKFDQTTIEYIIKLSNLILQNIKSNKLKELAIIDKLTGITTRENFEYEFREALQTANNTGMDLAVIMLDIDNFKQINDNFGHVIGDSVLREFGNILKKHTRGTDIVARYGGEEFAIVYKDVSELQAYRLANRIRRAVENTKFTHVNKTITVSIGISVFGKHGNGRDELIEKADHALYYSKQNGKNKATVWNTDIKDTLAIEAKPGLFLTGNPIEDGVIISSLLDLIDLIGSDKSREDRIYEFLDKVKDSIKAESGTIIFPHQRGSDRLIYSIKRGHENFIDHPRLNHDLIQKVSYEGEGTYLIDWESFSSDEIYEGSNWESVIVLPINYKNEIKAVLYLTSPVNEKEFTYSDYRIALTFGKVFSALI